jgi:hypothetical protein
MMGKGWLRVSDEILTLCRTPITDVSKTNNKMMRKDWLQALANN